MAPCGKFRPSPCIERAGEVLVDLVAAEEQPRPTRTACLDEVIAGDQLVSQAVSDDVDRGSVATEPCIDLIAHEG